MTEEVESGEWRHRPLSIFREITFTDQAITIFITQIKTLYSNSITYLHRRLSVNYSSSKECRCFHGVDGELLSVQRIGAFAFRLHHTLHQLLCI